MSWVKLDDKFHSNPKVVEAGNEAAGVYARALAFCGAYFTDGFISRKQAANFALTRVLRRVTDAGLWTEVSPGETREVTGRRDSGHRALPDVTVEFKQYGFFIEDFLHHNPTQAEADAARAKRRSAGAKGGQANASADAQANASADAQAPACEKPPKIASTLPTSPDQSRESEKPVLSVEDNAKALHQLVEAVVGADNKTFRTFENELRTLQLVDAAYVLKLAAKCAAEGDKGAGWALNALRAENARRLISGVGLRVVDGAA